jgi:cytochrome c oxidase assembly protein subunit 15
LVVSTNLLPEMVTVHMAVALLIVALLIYAVDRSQRAGQESHEAELSWTPATGLSLWLWVITLATFGQIILGTQVREQIDVVAAAADYGSRANWVEQLGLTFKIHRSFSLLLLLLNLYVAYRLYQTRSQRLQRLANVVLLLIMLEIAAGVTLAYFALPAAVQPVHLTVATVLFGAQFLTIIRYRRQMKTQGQAAIPRVVA